MPDISTSPSLLERLRSTTDQAAWQRLVDLYKPLLYGWLRRHGVHEPDADDLVQDVLTVVVRELPGFEYDKQRGSFRGWLRTILVNRLRNFWRARQARPAALGGSDFLDKLQQLEDPNSALSRQWQEEHDRHVARRLLDTIERDFEPTTWQAFCRVAVHGMKASAVATELGMSVNAVFIAKSRVLRRLRQELRGLTD